MIKRYHLKDTAPQTAAIENIVQRSCTYKSQMFIKKKKVPEYSFGRQPQNFPFLVQHAPESDHIHV